MAMHAQIDIKDMAEKLMMTGNAKAYLKYVQERIEG